MSQNAIKLGVVMDPIADITYKKDTTLTLLWAAEAMGWSLYYLEQEDLYLYEGRAMGSVRPLKVHRDPLKPVGQFNRNRRQFNASSLLKVRKLCNLQTVE